MSEYKTFDAGTTATCNRCDAKFALPRAVNAIQENAASWRIVDMLALRCGHMDAHWIYNRDLSAPVRECVRAKSRQKWYSVVIFEKEPRDNPTTSKEGQTIAKFIGLGDAWLYAQEKAKAPGSIKSWAVVIR